MDIKLLRSRDLLGLIDDRKLPELAIQALNSSSDTEMMQMVLCSSDDLECIRQAKIALFDREGVLNMSKIEGAVYYAKDVCNRILSGEIDPIAGSDEISRVSISVRNSGFHLLDPFVYASSEIPGRPDDRDFFINAIVQEAANLVSTLEKTE